LPLRQRRPRPSGPRPVQGLRLRSTPTIIPSREGDKSTMNPSESDHRIRPGFAGSSAWALDRRDRAWPAMWCLRLWWGHLAQKRLDALVNDIHARGGRSDQRLPDKPDCRRPERPPLSRAAPRLPPRSPRRKSDWLSDEEAA
jgi:hypothetical protein